jgi:hypothetical protein
MEEGEADRLRQLVRLNQLSHSFDLNLLVFDNGVALIKGDD